MYHLLNDINKCKPSTNHFHVISLKKWTVFLKIELNTTKVTKWLKYGEKNMNSGIKGRVNHCSVVSGSKLDKQALCQFLEQTVHKRQQLSTSDEWSCPLDSDP